MRPDMPLSGHSSRLLLDGAGSIAGGRDWDKVGGIVDNHCREDHPDQFRGHGAIRAAAALRRSEWVDDLPAWWTYQLAELESVVSQG